jgi:HlyD family secretion protein
MTVSIPKAQAEQIAPDQSVDITMDSIPGLSRRATITKITPGMLSGGEPGCVVDLVLTELDPRMQDGMDAQVHVVTGSLDNVLMVPKSAVQGVGQNGTVVVIGPGGQHRSVPVAIGVVGTDRVQVVSGLKEGDQVLTSS